MSENTAQGWQTMDTAPVGAQILLYFPASTGRNQLPEMTRVELYPCPFPRKPTHWMPLPTPPEPLSTTLPTVREE